MEEDKETKRRRLMGEFLSVLKQKQEEDRKWLDEFKANQRARVKANDEWLKEMYRLVLEHRMHIIRAKS